MPAKETTPQYVSLETYENKLARLGQNSEARDIHHKNEVVRSLNPFVEEQLKFLGKPEKKWFPADLFPNHEEVKKQAANLSPLTVAMFVGNAVTEKALPAYMTALNRTESTRDISGRDLTPWGKWDRGWTADEMGHDEAMRDWIILSGRVDIRSFDILVFNLVKNGFDPATGADPYKAGIFTSFQELATLISHKNTGLRAASEGDSLVDGACRGHIAPDEARHATFYRNVTNAVFDTDPDGATIAFADMMKTTIVMPGALMTDDFAPISADTQKTDFFRKFETATQKAEIYTVYDYLNIYDSLINAWDIENRKLTTPEAEKAREDLFKRKRVLTITADRIFKSIQESEDTEFNFVLNPRD